MGLRISTNIAAINGRRHLTVSESAIANSFAQLSSGSRINKAADDAAGLSISEHMTSTLRSIRQANRNAMDGISMVQTAEGGLNEISNIVIRLRELGIQSASDTVGNIERSFIQKEVSQLKNEIDRIAQVTKWGKINLLDGSTPPFDFQVGIYNDPFEDRITFDPGDNNATLAALGLDGIDFSSKEGAQDALESLDGASKHVNSIRANIGALENRLVHSAENQRVYEENMAAARSRIRDTDVAQASTELARNQILHNANVATLAQANQLHIGALKLLN